MNLSTTRCIALVAASLVTAVAAAQDPFAYEGFQYGPGPELNGHDGGTGWNNDWGKLSSIPTGIANSGLSWPDLVTNGNCPYTAGFPSTTFTLYTRVLAPYTATNDTIYVSFLMEPGPGFGEGGGLSFSAVPNIIVGASLGQGVYGLTEPFVASNDSNVPVILGETALLVTRIVSNGDGTSTYSMFVNPNVGQPQPAVPSCEMTIAGTLPQVVALVNDGGFATDEIRFGATWSSVLPTTLPPQCPADLDNDGAVGGADLAVLLGAWGHKGADLTGDNVTDASDLAILLGAWGPCN